MGNQYKFPSMKAIKMLSVLKALGYRSVAKSGPGSHTWLEADGRPRIRWAFHNKVSLAPGLVRSILMKEAGLTFDEAREAVENG